MKRSLILLIFSFLVLFAFVVSLIVAPELTISAERKGSNSGLRLTKPTGQPISTLVNINNLAMWIRADGWSSRDPSTGNSGGFFPRGVDAGVIFADGLMWGGLVDDGATPTLRAGGQTYNIGTVEGAIVSKGVAENPDDPNVRIWRIRRDYQTADLRQDAAELNRAALSAVSDAQIQQVRDQYAKDWNEWPWQKGAPYYDRNGDGAYDPNVDEPGIANADQVVWFVANDLDPGATQNLYGSPPIGLEMQVTLWAYARTDALGNVIFKQFKFIYKGTAATPATAKIDSMYVAQWSDPDLGEYTDDFAGSDTLLSLGFVWNSTSVDPLFANFGLPSPAAGYDFFAGPTVKGGPDDVAIVDLKRRPGFRNLPMTSFVFFAAGSGISDPPFTYVGTEQWYNLLRGFQPAGPVTNPNPYRDPNGNPAKFVMPGDPVTGSGWIDGIQFAAGDRRIVLDSGPFKMALGDTQAVVISLLAGLGADARSSVAVLKFVDRFAQDAFNNLFELPKAPPSPKTVATELDGSILLNWASDPAAVAATEGQDVGGYKFEGYNVYQLPSATASFDQAIKLATFDVVNEITTILAESFDVPSGQILKLPVQIGKNTGISRFMTIKEDRFRSRPLVNGATYYFAITAYNANPDPLVAVPSLESPLQILAVVPQSTKPGVRIPSKPGEVLKIAHTGASDGNVEPIVVDPTKTTGHEYKVTFKALEGGESAWTLTDVTANKVLLADQTNQSGDDNYLVTDGLQVKVLGPPPGMKDWQIPSGVRRFTFAGGADGFHFEGFNGAIGWASPNQVFGGGPPGVPAPNIKNVLLKLANVDVNGNYDPNDPNVSYAYRYGRGFANPPAKPEFAPFIVNPSGGYSYQDFTKSVPLAAFDVEANPPRRLVVGHLENNVAGGLVDGKWWPPNFQVADNTAGGGPREWLWIYDANYSETPNPAFQVEAIGTPMPIMYWLTVARRGNVPFTTGDEFLILANHVNSEADVFTFKSSAPTQDLELAKQDVDKLVNVYPNPYMGFNRAELNRFDRFVTFTHLPQQATIRIFSLAGVLVRTIMKDDDSQFIRWNLQNEDGLPAASGIYLAHVDMPSLGKTKILKLAIIQEQQFLDRF
jgi:hypothetical protein